MNVFKKTLLCAVMAVGLPVMSASAIAADYPNKPISLVVGFPPGGGADVLARTIAPRLAEELGQPVVVENKPGASGIIATGATARAPADGYHLYLATPGSLTILPNLQEVPYDPAKFSAISLLVTMPNILVTGANSGIESVQDLIAKTKASGNGLAYASGGNGTIGQMAGEQFNMLAGIKMMHVPYRGTTPALTDVMAGIVPATFSDPSTKNLVEGGKLRALAVTDTKRSPLFPGVPTMEEAGVPGYKLVNWYGLIGPEGMPADVVKRLNDVMVKVMAEPAVIEKLGNTGGMSATSSTPQEFADLMASERTKWVDLIKKANISLK